MSKKIVVFNAPIESGKDSIADYVAVTYPHARKMEMKRALVDITLSVYGVSRSWWDNNYTRHGKEIPREELQGRSMREALIHTSEDVIKPSYGRDFFGKYSRREIDRDKTSRIFVYSDGGFHEELQAIGDGERPLLIRIHRDGYAYDPNVDSRSYIKDSEIPDNWTIIDVENNGTWEEFVQKVDVVLKDFFK